MEGERSLVQSLVYSQIEVHQDFGGVVPELAARAHLEKLPALVSAALERSGVSARDVSRVAVTRGPGLAGPLVVGVGLARGLACAWERPLVGVNHLWGHVYAAFLTREDLKPPLLALVVSGGHTDLVLMPDHGVFQVLGSTLDDAAGEAFDKAARMLGLGFPGGPALDRRARAGKAERQRLPKPRVAGLDFSFSGLKTALLYRLRDLGGLEAVSPETVDDLGAAFQESLVWSLTEKLALAARAHPVREVVVCGGVAANSHLRSRVAEALVPGQRLTIPPLGLCTDNAAMIAAASWHSPAGAATAVAPALGWEA